MLLGFTNATLGRNAEISFTGLNNFIELAGDRRFWQSFGIGIVWAGSVAILTLVSAIGRRRPLRSYVVRDPRRGDCWVWAGAVGDDGYGRFWTAGAGTGQRTMRPQRFLDRHLTGMDLTRT